jgi:tetratricopeptide (TPR) repeat protein
MTALAGQARTRRRSRIKYWLLLALSVAALVPVQRRIDRRKGAPARFAEAAYVPSSEVLRRLSLGYEGLLADIYWTRAVQYFGRQRLARATQFELLGPMLRTATALDPHLIIAYRYGAIFLAEKSPGGAGRPDEALGLLRRGIVANPDDWRLWQDLGFIYYGDLKDYARAAQAFAMGSERPGAPLWMKAMAAVVAAQGGELETSRLLWMEMYRHPENDQLRTSALEHLAALQAQEQLERLDALLAAYGEREGRAARSLQELVKAGLLRALPRDPSGAPYVLGADGRARLAPSSKVDLRLLQ